MKRNKRTGQHGQAILWFLSTTAACCAMLALVYNVGQVTNEKEKTVNAADAAALSGGLVEARMLNFMAYTNRAMIANEVTIAQLVSLDAWVRYDNQVVQNLAEVTSFIPYVDEVTQAIAEVTNAAQQVVDDTTKVTIPITDTFVQGLGLAREAANAVAVLAAKDVASQVAQANQTTFGNRFDVAPQVVNDNAFDVAALAANEASWLQFSKVYGKNDSGGDDRGNAAQVVKNSRDQFSTHRGAGLLIDGINLVLGGPIAVSSLSKTSGDTVLATYDRWEAQDSLDWKVLGIDLLPIGWGRADADQNGTRGNDWDYGGGPCTDNFAFGCELAYDEDNPISGFSGIPGIRDLSKPGNSSTSDPSVTYVVAVKKSADAAMTTQRIGSGMNNVHIDGPQGSPDLQDNLQKDQITSISAARVFFARPDWNSKDITEGNLPRADHVHEYASLYNPYWQARLTTPDVLTTSLLYAAIGQPGLNLATP